MGNAVIGKFAVIEYHIGIDRQRIIIFTEFTFIKYEGVY